MPLATLTATPPAVIGKPLISVIKWPVFSKLSLAFTSMTTGVSSLVSTDRSLSMSTNGVTVRLIVRVSDSPLAGSVTV